MNVHHDPIFDTDEIAKTYSEKDSVPVKYVMTSELPGTSVRMDIFYRSTPHPEFGNKYFGVFFDTIQDSAMITNADELEGAAVAMIDIDGKWYYSAYRHDYVSFTDSQGNTKTVDGGRAYARGWDYKIFKVENGEFVKAIN